jgi:hypothetical protein
MSDECKLIDNHKVLTIAPRDLAMRYLKHDCPDGEYAIQGPGINMLFYRIEGVIYPGGGEIDGEVIPLRSRDECKAFFDNDPSLN